MRSSVSRLSVVAIIAAAIIFGFSCTEKDNPVDPANNRPEVTIVSLAANASYLVGDTVTFTATVIDSEDDELPAGSIIWVSDKDGQIGTGTTFRTASLTVNTHLIVVAVTDSEDAIGADSATVIIRPDGIGVVSITGPADASELNFGDTIVFVGVGSDPEDGDFTGTDLVWTSDVDGQIGTGDTLRTAVLSSGAHTIVLSATDSDDHTVTDSITLTIIDRVGVVYITGPADSLELNFGDTIVFVGVGSDPEDGDFTGSDLVWTSDIDGQIGTGDTLRTTALSTGVHVITLSATDTGDNTVTDSITFGIALTFEKNLGDYDWYGYSACMTSDGGYLLTGTTPENSYDISLFKADSLGDFVGSNTFGGVLQDVGHFITGVSSGDYLIVGETGTDVSIPGSGDVVLIKVDVGGNKIWEESYGGAYDDIGFSVCEAFDGGYVGTGSKSRANEQEDLYVFKTDSDGTLLWEKDYGVDSTFEIGNSIVPTSDGGYMVAGKYGYEYEPGYVAAGWGMCLMKLDGAGAVVWERRFLGIDLFKGGSVCAASDGSFVVVGMFLNCEAGNWDFWMIKVDASGNTIWENNYGQADEDDYGFFVSETSDGGYIFTGSATQPGVEIGERDLRDICLIRTDINGNLLWQRMFGGVDDIEDGTFGFQTADGGYFAGGESELFTGGRRMHMVKTDSLGNVR